MILQGPQATIVFAILKLYKNKTKAEANKRNTQQRFHVDYKI